MKKRKRLKTVRDLDRQTGQYSETRGLRSAAFNVSKGLPSTSGETADELYRFAEALLENIGETTPGKIVLACGERRASREEMTAEMQTLMTRLNSKYGVFSPPACAGKFLVTQHAALMAIYDLRLAPLGVSAPELVAESVFLLVDAYADAWHWWHAELKGEHVSAAAKAKETDRLRKQGRTTGDKGEIRAKIIRAAIDKLPRPLSSSIKAIARDIRAGVEKSFRAERLTPPKTDAAFYELVRSVGRKDPEG